jgi:hypothetical protein
MERLGDRGVILSNEEVANFVRNNLSIFSLLTNKAIAVIFGHRADFDKTKTVVERNAEVLRHPNDHQRRIIFGNEEDLSEFVKAAESLPDPVLFDE